MSRSIKNKIRIVADRFGGVKALSELTGINQSLISQYMNGRCNPSFEFIYALNKLNVDLNWLFEEYDEESKLL